jgi:hypothetical protein
MSFQNIILIIAIVLLILVLIMFGIAIRNNTQNENYPPVQSECPDYWTVKKGKNGMSICVNEKHLGDANCQKEMSFDKGSFVGPQGLCNKQKWAKSCKITWDGITNSTGLCK